MSALIIGAISFFIGFCIFLFLAKPIIGLVFMVIGIYIFFHDFDSDDPTPQKGSSTWWIDDDNHHQSNHSDNSWWDNFWDSDFDGGDFSGSDDSGD